MNEENKKRGKFSIPNMNVSIHSLIGLRGLQNARNIPIGVTDRR